MFRIFEIKIFGCKLGKKSLKIKWIKNGFCFVMVCFCGVILVLGIGNFDKFVVFIGSVVCVLFVYVYLVWFYYKGVVEIKVVKFGDFVMVVLGLVGMVYMMVVMIINSFM